MRDLPSVIRDKGLKLKVEPGKLLGYTPKLLSDDTPPNAITEEIHLRG